MPESQSRPSLRDNPDEQYRLLTENVKDFAIFLLDTHGKIATWNTGAERITGYAEAEIIGQPFGILFRPQDMVNREPEQMAGQRWRRLLWLSGPSVEKFELGTEGSEVPAQCKGEVHLQVSRKKEDPV